MVEFIEGDGDGWSAVAGIDGEGAVGEANGIAVGAHEGEDADEKPDDRVGDGETNHIPLPGRCVIGQNEAEQFRAALANMRGEGGGDDDEVEEQEDCYEGRAVGAEGGLGNVAE